MLKKVKTTVYLVVWLIIVIGPGIFGWDYYTTPIQERPFTELHDILKPTGMVGHGYGIVGSFFITFGVLSYGMRKRMRVMQSMGKLRSWLTFHIFLCTSGPALVIWHTTFKFNGIVSISFWSMVVVVASGVLGRYVYNRIPKTEDGHFRTVKFIESEQDELRTEINNKVDLNKQQIDDFGIGNATMTFSTPWGALFSALKFDILGLFQWRRDYQLLNKVTIKSGNKLEVLRLIKSYRWRTRQKFLIGPLQKVFGYWHVFHIPLAAIMFIILAVHIGVAVVFGYTWIF